MSKNEKFMRIEIRIMGKAEYLNLEWGPIIYSNLTHLVCTYKRYMHELCSVTYQWYLNSRKLHLLSMRPLLPHRRHTHLGPLSIPNIGSGSWPVCTPVGSTAPQWTSQGIYAPSASGPLFWDGAWPLSRRKSSFEYFRSSIRAVRDKLWLRKYLALFSALCSEIQPNWCQ